MQKKIAKVSPAAFGHLMLELEDGTKQMVRHNVSPYPIGYALDRARV